MKEMYLLYIIPVVLLELVYGQVVVISPSEKKVAMGNDVLVTCELKMSALSEDTTYQWLDKNGDEVTNTNMILTNKLVLRSSMPNQLRLLIRDVNDDRAGVYKCVVSVNDQTFEGDFKLETYAPITFSNCPQQQHAVLGEEARVNCKVHASEALFTLWYKMNGGIQEALTQGSQYIFDTSGLLILNTSRAQGGMYMLNSEPQQSDTLLTPEHMEINLDIYEKPVITSPILETTAIVNGVASMYCRASGEPTPIYKWFKKDVVNELSNTERITVSQSNNQGILKFDPVTRDDEGQYTCQASVADIGFVESSNFMIVQTPPVIQEMKNVTGSEHQTIGLECTAFGDPPPALQWVKDDVGTQFNSGYSADGISVTSEDIINPDNPGTLLRLDFAELSYTNAGDYKCTATNNAGSDEKIIHLEVLFPPKFTNQPAGPYYNWKGNMDGHLPCVAEANPRAVFSWFKNGLKITDATDHFSIVNTFGPGKHVSMSKLMISYNGASDNDLFGEFKCTAANNRGESELGLNMEKAVIPGNPLVGVERYSARYIELAIQAPAVLGPDVTQFKAVITSRSSGQGDPIELWVERETRTFVDDRPNPITKLLIEHLEPSTQYIISVYAKNAVGLGNAVEVPASTKAISPPGIVKIITPVNSEYSNEILVQWIEPDDGGKAILAYRVEYRRVDDRNVTLGNNVIDKWQAIEGYITATSEVKPGDKQYTISQLYPGQFYQVQVKAENSVGTSIAAPKVIKTKEAEFAPGATTDPNYRAISGAPSLVRSSVALTIIATVTACLRNYVLM